MGPSNSSAVAVISRSIGNDVPASAGGAKRRVVQSNLRVVETIAVALRHLNIGEQMMAERHRLRALQVGEAGHHCSGMLKRLLSERLLVVAEQTVNVVDAVAHPQPEVGRHLIVARACCVQPLRPPTSSPSRTTPGTTASSRSRSKRVVSQARWTAGRTSSPSSSESDQSFVGWERVKAVSTMPMCVNACGKFPRRRPRSGSYSSEIRPRSFRSARSRS